MASSGVGLEAVAQGIPGTLSGTDIMEAVVEILHRAHPVVARPKRSRWVPDEPAGVTGTVGSSGGGVAHGARIAVATVGARSVFCWHLPGGDKFLGALRQGPPGQLEIVTGVPVEVATQPADAAPVGVGDGDEEVGGRVVEEPEAGGGLEDDVVPFLADPYLPVLRHQWQREVLAVHLRYGWSTRFAFAHPPGDFAHLRAPEDFVCMQKISTNFFLHICTIFCMILHAPWALACHRAPCA